LKRKRLPPSQNRLNKTSSRFETKSNARVKVVEERPVGKRGRVYVGTAADRLDEPAPVNPPTLRVASFSPTNNRCQ
jgi:hypothetical protein